MRQHTKFVRSSDMTDASVFDRGVVESDPCADHLVGLEGPVRHVLMGGHDGADARWFREDLTAVKTQRFSQNAFESTDHSRVLRCLEKNIVVTVQVERVAD